MVVVIFPHSSVFSFFLWCLNILITEVFWPLKWFLPRVLCVCAFAYVCRCMYVYVCGGGKLTLGVLLHCSPVCLLKQDFSLNLELTNSNQSVYLLLSSKSRGYSQMPCIPSFSINSRILNSSMHT